MRVIVGVGHCAGIGGSLARLVVVVGVIVVTNVARVSRVRRVVVVFIMLDDATIQACIVMVIVIVNCVGVIAVYDLRIMHSDATSFTCFFVVVAVDRGMRQ